MSKYIKPFDMKITESQLRNIITKTINENIFEQGMQQNPYADLDNEAREKAIEIENQIEILQNQANTLMKIGEVCLEADREIKEMFQGIQGPTKENYYYVYKFSQPIPYNEETYQYGNIEEGFEEKIKNMFPEEIKNAVNIYVIEKNNILYGFELSIEIDDIEGWY